MKELKMSTPERGVEQLGEDADKSDEAVIYSAKANDFWIKEAEREANQGYKLGAAKAYEKAGQDDKAKEFWQEDLKHTTRNGSKFFRRAAEAYEKLGQEDKAKEYWQKEADMERSHALKTVNSIIDTYKNSSSYFKMEATRQEYAMLASLNIAAKAYEKLGQKDKIRELWEEIVVAQREHLRHFHIVAEAYEELGQEDKAKEYWQKETERGDDYAIIAKAYEKLGQEDKAKEYWQIEAEKRRHQGYLVNAAKAYEKAGEKDEARKVWQQMAELGESQMHFSIAAEAYENLGQKDKAIEFWKKEAAEKETKRDFLFAAKAYEHIAEICGKD